MRALVADGLSHALIAERYGCSVPYVGRLLRRRAAQQPKAQAPDARA